MNKKICSRICKLMQPYLLAHRYGCVASQMRLRESVSHVSFFYKSKDAYMLTNIYNSIVYISNYGLNLINLPQVVTFSNGSTITYLYAADGRKLRTVHVINGFSFTTDYSGNVIYENGSQKLLLTEEGYIDLTDSNKYSYYLVWLWCTALWCSIGTLV